MKQIRLGIIGTGFIANIFSEFVSQNENYSVQAVLGTSKEKAVAFIEDKGFEAEAYDNIGDFSKSGIETVYIASPNSLHFDQAKTLLQAKLNVIVEKPAVTKVGQFEELVTIAEANDVIIVEAFRHLFDPVFLKLKEEIRKFDKVTGASIQYKQYSSRYDNFKKGIIAPAFSKEFEGGAIRDLGVYGISALTAMFGAPNSSVYYPQILSSGVDGSGTAIIRYDEFDATIQVSKTQESHLECEFYDNSKNKLSVDNIATLNYLKYNDELVIEGNELKVDLSQEIQAFAELILDTPNKTYPYSVKELNNISKITHNIIANL
jgi:predicted dehydrogenase